MEYVKFNELSRIEKADVMLYLELVKKEGVFINQTLAHIETDWEYAPPFFTLMDNAYLTVAELYNAIRIEVTYLLNIKNNGNINALMIDSNMDSLLREACLDSVNHGNDLYVCKFLTAYGKFVQAFLYISPQISDLDLNAIKAAINQGAAGEAITNMLINIIAGYCLSWDYKYKFGRNIENLSDELALRIKSDADKILTLLKAN